MASTQYFYYPNAKVIVGSNEIAGVQRATFSREDAYRSAYSHGDGLKPEKVVIDGPPRYTLSFTTLDRQGSYNFNSSSFKEGLIEGNSSVLNAKISDGITLREITKGFITSCTYQVSANEFPTKTYTISGPQGQQSSASSTPAAPSAIFNNTENKLPKKINIPLFSLAKIKSFSASFSRELFFIYESPKRQPKAVFLTDRDKIECSVETYSLASISNGLVNINCGSCDLKDIKLISVDQNVGLSEINTVTYKFEGTSPNSSFTC